ncbi:unnamed protein product [Trichobilharzia regenti]|nr:unnamed protein product [Trichobilharzia regenti]
MKALMLKVREHSEWIVKCRRRVRNLTSKNEVPIPTDTTTTEYDSMKTKSESEDSDSDHSDSSYDIDDGRTVTHVSKSKGKKKAAKKDGQVGGGISGDDKAGQDESEESDFDLEAALMDEDDNDNKSEITGAPDELSEFELEGDSSDDEKDSFTTDFDDDDDVNEDSDVEMTDLTKSSKPSVNRKKKTSGMVKKNKKKVKTNKHVVPKKPIPKGKHVSATSKSQQPVIKHSDSTKTQSLVKDKKKKAKKRPIVDK